MKLDTKIGAVPLFGFLSFYFLPLIIALRQSTSSSVYNHRHVIDSDKVPHVPISNSEYVRDDEDDILDFDPGVHQVASENFLQSLREKCKEQKSISIICNNLRIIIPITSHKTDTEDNRQISDDHMKYSQENIKLYKRFTDPEGTVNPETYLARPEENEDTTALPMNSRYGFYYNHAIKQNKNKIKEPILFTEGMPTYEDTFKQLYESSYPNVPEEHRLKISGISHNMANQNHMITDELQEEHGDDTRSTEKVFPKMKDFDESVTKFKDVDNDYDEIDEEENDKLQPREEDTNFETGDTDDENFNQDLQDRKDCIDKVNCSTQADDDDITKNDTAVDSEYSDKAEAMVDRIIDDSVKIFKNSFTIKFPTFERVTNAVTEWYQTIFGTKTRDEARGRIKKALHPIIVALMVKGVIFLVTVIGFTLKVIAAKAVVFSIAATIFAAVLIFKKISAPQGGTIFVHTNGGHKNGPVWDKDDNSFPNRLMKNIAGYQVYENKNVKSEYSTPANYHYNNYNGYYKPNNGFYTTTSSPYLL